ncbi:UPF0246 protein YaaA [hydrothermal vent metagenome]|uniref:UPF0246 protein YaaA n=1 Tax=hydrothermal vent metagenome TaxID=652676 RepID=A0A3B1DT27_9ZZZZ
MKILLAPAETKLDTGDKQPISENNFAIKSLYKKQLEVLGHYQEFIKNNELEELSRWFGLKKIDECKKYLEPLSLKRTTKAISRYAGVAFEALNYSDLNREERIYCDNNIFIFSNLFGVVKASDLIPDYKYKQGAKLPNIEVDVFYKKHLKNILDSYLGDEVADLRAGYYDKFYKPVAPTLTFKFIKNKKTVSHWAKYYRGIVARTMAQNNIQSLVELMDMPIAGLTLVEIKEVKNIKTLVMNID